MSLELETTPLPPPPMELARPLVGGRYLLDGLLGQGGMGRVHRAYHRQLGRAFALKVIAPTLHSSPELRAQLLAEAKLASELAHPHIVGVIDLGDDPAVGVYMVMELLDGTPLALAPDAPLPVARACEYLRQITEAVEHIHARGVVHGDLKPDNMMLIHETSGERRRSLIKLLDFGLARRISAGDDGPEARIAGTPEYLAPERLRGAPPSVASDVYALGAMALELLTGAPPFVGALDDVLHGHLDRPPPRIDARRREPVDARLEELVARALAKDPRDRHASVAELRYELQAAMAMLGIHRRAARGSGCSLGPIADQSPFGHAVLSVDHRVVAATPAFCKMLRLTADEVGAADLARTPLGEAFPDLAAHLAAAAAARDPLERRALVGDPAAPIEVVLWIGRGRTPREAFHVVLRLRRL